MCRGFERSVRMRIFEEMVRSNRPSIPEVILTQNPSLSSVEVEEAYQAWREAAGSWDEGRAGFG